MVRPDAEKIEELRLRRGLSRSGLSREARLAPQTASNIISGRTGWTHEGTLVKLAFALGVAPADLLR